MNEAPLPTVGR